MRKLLALILSLAMILTLAACSGDPIDTNPTDDPTGTTTSDPTNLPDKPETVDLVTAYETENGLVLGGAYRMDFVYGSDYRSGTVTLSSESNENTLEGTFTCDENYNINSIEIHEDDTVANFVMTFNSDHQLLSVEINSTTDGETTLLYSAKYAYNDRGNSTYSERFVPGLLHYISETEYDAQNRILRQKSTTGYYVDDALQTTSSSNTYEYTENGALKAISSYDDQNQLVGSVEFTAVPEGENFRCTAEMDGSKMVMVMTPQGKSLLTEMYNGTELYNKIETTVDEQGRIHTQTQWSIYSDATTVTTYDYAANGRLSSCIMETNGVETIVERTTFTTVQP